jgi:hypothetical protein
MVADEQSHFCPRCGASLSAAPPTQPAPLQTWQAPPAQQVAWQQQAQQYGTTQQYPGQALKTNGLAVASLVLGLLWLFWLGSLLAVIFGFVSLLQIERSNGTQRGRGMAIAGIILGCIGLAVFAAIFIAGFIEGFNESRSSRLR